MYDPERYRSKDEVAAWRERDPITLLTTRLTGAALLTDDDVAAIERDVTAEVDAAVAAAEAGTLEPVEDLTRFVTSEVRR
jgi:TPP-dependent pyruvate/acetoin dehydrogenase alpha subunit